jgi:hypothetical protein
MWGIWLLNPPYGLKRGMKVLNTNDASTEIFVKLVDTAEMLYKHSQKQTNFINDDGKAFHAALFFYQHLCHAKAISLLPQCPMSIFSVAALVRALIETYGTLAYITYPNCDNEKKLRIKVVTYVARLDRIQIQYKYKDKFECKVAHSLNKEESDLLKKEFDLLKKELKEEGFEDEVMGKLGLKKELELQEKGNIQERFHIKKDDRCKENNIDVERFDFYYALACSYAHGSGYAVEMAIGDCNTKLRSKFLCIACMFLSKSIDAISKVFLWEIPGDVKNHIERGCKLLKPSDT